MKWPLIFRGTHEIELERQKAKLEGEIASWKNIHDVVLAKATRLEKELESARDNTEIIQSFDSMAGDIRNHIEEIRRSITDMVTQAITKMKGAPPEGSIIVTLEGLAEYGKQFQKEAQVGSKPVRKVQPAKVLNRPDNGGAKKATRSVPRKS